MSHKERCECFFCRNPKIPKKIDKILKIINAESLDERLLIAQNFVRGMINTIELGEGNQGVINRVGILDLIKYDVINEHKAFAVIKKIGDEEEKEEGKLSYVA